MNTWTLDKKRKGDLPIYQYFLRKSQNTKSLLRLINLFLFKTTSFLYKCEISSKAQIGPGLFVGHPYCITINSAAILGKNCNIHKGVTIGQENRGKRKGTPTIGDNVWIGINSTIVGKIKIGDDVLIAPNTYVNTDVPSHSIVLGNPCIIKNRPNATEGYINNQV